MALNDQCIVHDKMTRAVLKLGSNSEKKKKNLLTINNFWTMYSYLCLPLSSRVIIVVKVSAHVILGHKKLHCKMKL